MANAFENGLSDVALFEADGFSMFISRLSDELLNGHQDAEILMDCEKALPFGEIAGYALGKGSSTPGFDMEAHVKACPSCQVVKAKVDQMLEADRVSRAERRKLLIELGKSEEEAERSSNYGCRLLVSATELVAFASNGHLPQGYDLREHIKGCRNCKSRLELARNFVRDNRHKRPQASS